MAAIANTLLAALPRKSYLRLLPNLVPVELGFGDVLYEPGKPIRDVYFPGQSLVSLLTLVEGHLALEVGLVGREGMVGVPLALGIDASPVRALVGRRARGSHERRPLSPRAQPQPAAAG